MAKVIDLLGVARGDALIEHALELNPAALSRLTTEDIAAMYNEPDTVILSIRVPKTLADKLAAYARKEAYRRDTRVTRNSVVNEFLEAALREQVTRDKPIASPISGDVNKSNV